MKLALPVQFGLMHLDTEKLVFRCVKRGEIRVFLYLSPHTGLSLWEIDFSGIS